MEGARIIVELVNLLDSQIATIYFLFVLTLFSRSVSVFQFGKIKSQYI